MRCQSLFFITHQRFKLSKELNITYPCEWVYKVIGTDCARMTSAVLSVINSGNPDISGSRESRNGKYTCLNVRTNVSSEEERKKIFNLLADHSDIKMVL